jgi:hypothetical protein
LALADDVVVAEIGEHQVERSVSVEIERTVRWRRDTWAAIQRAFEAVEGLVAVEVDAIFEIK